MNAALPQDPCPLGTTLMLARRVRGMKQSHIAELLGITQPTVSRIECRDLRPTGRLRDRLLDFVAARLDPARDAALVRLVQGADAPVHLVCDLTHRVLAASRAREHGWRRTVAELGHASLWRYASEAIRSAEARLPALGWGERDGAHAFEFATGANDSDELRIAPSVLLWERILLSDGSTARLVTCVAAGSLVELV